MADQQGATRLDLNDPEDVQYLVSTGLAWRSGPKTTQLILKSITDGTTQRNPSNEPPEVTAFLDKVTRPQPDEEPPLGDITAPVTEPVQPSIGEPIEPPVADGEPPLA